MFVHSVEEEMSEGGEEELLVPLDDDSSRGVERDASHSLSSETKTIRVSVMNRTILAIIRHSRDTLEYQTQLISVTPQDIRACRNFVLGHEKRIAFFQSTWIIEISDDGVRIYRQTLASQSASRSTGRLRFVPPDEEHGIFLETDDARYERFIKSLKSALDKCARSVNSIAKTDMPVESRSPKSWLNWLIHCQW